MIELLVVLTIITVVTSIIFSSRSDFNNSVLLSNTAYDIALTIRNTQSYGIGSRADSIINTGAGRGVHFAKETDPNSFIIFSDSNDPSQARCHGLPGMPDEVGREDRPDAKRGDCRYTSNEAVQTIDINNGMFISDLCIYTPDKSCGLTSLDIVSVRPNTEWFFAKSNGYVSSATRACVEIESQQGFTRAIEINKSGLITAGKATCP